MNTQEGVIVVAGAFINKCEQCGYVFSSGRFALLLDAGGSRHLLGQGCNRVCCMEITRELLVFATQDEAEKGIGAYFNGGRDSRFILCPLSAYSEVG